MRNLRICVAVSTVALICLLLSGCANRGSISGQSYVPSAVTAASERDEIWGLLAYSAVVADWQTDKTRGHNIGSVLIDPEGQPVFHAVNRRYEKKNGTQHGEVRLVQGWLDSDERSYIEGFTVYTSLEPCAMCAGMMALTKTARVVYGQSDPGYGRAIERLALDAPGGSEGPYPRLPSSEPLRSQTRIDLEEAFERARPEVNDDITAFLRSPEARRVFEQALRRLESYKTRYPENESVLDSARRYLDSEIKGHH